MKDERLENPDLIKKSLQPEGQWPHPMHHFLAARCKSRWPRVRNFFRRLCSLREVTVQSPYVEFPRLTASSIWLYHASDKLSLFRQVRYCELPVAAYLLMFSRVPEVLAFVLFLGYHIAARSIIYEPLRRTALRLDYLPNLRMVSVTKIGWGGRLKNSLWRLEDFERVDTRPDLERLGAVWKTYPLMDMELMYRNKTTGELLCFDVQGLWNCEGLEHPDLNGLSIPSTRD